MKNLLTFIFCLLTLGTLVAQFQLDVEGDAKILGRLDLQSAGSENTFVGKNAGANNGSGDSNSFFGLDAGINNKGESNAFFGAYSGSDNEGNHNTYFGNFTGKWNSTGFCNAYFGSETGFLHDNTRSTLLGMTAGTTESLDRAIAIGYEAQVACDNCAVIGGIKTADEDNSVKVGIGTTTPLTDLHIKQTATDPGRGIRLEYHQHSAYWTTYIDAVDDYNFRYNNSLIGYIQDQDGQYVDLVPFTNPNGGSESRSNNIRSMEKVLDKVKKLRPNSKTLTNSRTGQKAWGFIAEEVAELFPEITPEKDGQKGIIYDYFGILSIKAIQELATDLDIQTKENEQLKEVVEQQQKQINENKALKEVVEQQQFQIDELKSLVETLLTQNAETPKSNSYVLPLEQKALLAQNQPNPFRENTLVDYFVPAEVQNAHIQVTNMDGKVLGQVSITEKGKGQVTIQSKSYPAGTYFYSLVLDGQVMDTKRMVLAR